MQWLYDARRPHAHAALGRRHCARAVHLPAVLVPRRVPDDERHAGPRAGRSLPAGDRAVSRRGSSATAISARRRASGTPTARCCGSSSVTPWQPASRLARGVARCRREGRQVDRSQARAGRRRPARGAAAARIQRRAPGAQRLLLLGRLLGRGGAAARPTVSYVLAASDDAREARREADELACRHRAQHRGDSCAALAGRHPRVALSPHRLRRRRLAGRRLSAAAHAARRARGSWRRSRRCSARRSTMADSSRT